MYAPLCIFLLSLNYEGHYLISHTSTVLQVNAKRQTYHRTADPNSTTRTAIHLSGPLYFPVKMYYTFSPTATRDTHQEPFHNSPLASTLVHHAWCPPLTKILSGYQPRLSIHKFPTLTRFLCKSSTRRWPTRQSHPATHRGVQSVP